MERITKDEILEGIKTCSQLTNIWYNGSSPNVSFKRSIKSISTTLEKLLSLHTRMEKIQNED